MYFVTCTLGNGVCGVALKVFIIWWVTFSTGVEMEMEEWEAGEMCLH